MGRKPFQPEDHALWDEVKRGIAPLKLKKGGKAKRKTTMTVAPKERLAEARSQIAHHTPHIAWPAASTPPPPLAAFDRRTAQKLNRGQSEPDARLDLHGEGVETARIKLLHFLASQRHQGSRLVLVITGKGSSPFARHTLHGMSYFHSPEREGRLRREVPLWLHEEGFRIHAVGFQPAHPRHGGGGAFYVRLRRNASP
jgi:DNA-nicking Smr family endonuclease